MLGSISRGSPSKYVRKSFVVWGSSRFIYWSISTSWNILMKLCPWDDEAMKRMPAAPLVTLEAPSVNFRAVEGVEEGCVYL